MYEKRFLTIPVPAYIKDFLTSIYGTEDINLPKNDRLSMILKAHVRPGLPKGRHQDLPKDTKVRFSFTHLKAGPMAIWLRQQEQRLINQYLIEYVFYPLFYEKVDSLVGRGMCIQDAIDEFVKLFNLNYDHIQFETLKKRYYRYRKASEITKKKYIN